jgi:hypothetical protein
MPSGAPTNPQGFRLLDMSWNVLCPNANATLKTVRSNEYYCAFCAVSNEPEKTRG